MNITDAVTYPRVSQLCANGSKHIPKVQAQLDSPRALSSLERLVLRLTKKIYLRNVNHTTVLSVLCTVNHTIFSYDISLCK